MPGKRKENVNRKYLKNGSFNCELSLNSMRKKKPNIKRLFFIIALALLLCSVSVFFNVMPVKASKDDLPFHPGEKLTYKIKWCGIPAGEAVLSVLPIAKINGRDAYHFEMTVQSYRWLDPLYKVRDRITSYTDFNMSKSLLYRKNQKEGKTRRKVIVNFNWELSQAQYSNFDDLKTPISLKSGTFDPLAVLYVARMKNLDRENRIEIPVTDGKKCIISRAEIVRREKIKTENGVYDTFLLEAEIDEIGGVFEKSRDAGMKIWLTADHRKLPVKLDRKSTRLNSSHCS